MTKSTINVHSILAFPESCATNSFHPLNKYDKVLVVAKKGWQHGIIGIVASKLTEKYYKPTVLLTIEDGEATGSARSIKGFSIFDALIKCKHLLNKFGGHDQAAGLGLDAAGLLNNAIIGITDLPYFLAVLCAVWEGCLVGGMFAAFIGSLKYKPEGGSKKKKKSKSAAPEPTLDSMDTFGSKSSSEADFCTNCGAKILDGDEFCTNCGAKKK